MKLYKIVYWEDGHQHISIVIASEEEKAKNCVSYKELHDIKEIDFSRERVVHTETIEII